MKKLFTHTRTRDESSYRHAGYVRRLLFACTLAAFVAGGFAAAHIASSSPPAWSKARQLRGSGGTTPSTTTTTATTTTTPTATTTTAPTTTTSPTPPPPPPSPSPSGSVLFRGDYDTGNFSQWSDVQSDCTGGGYSLTNVGNTCASVVPSPVVQGSDAGKFVLSPDNPVQSSTDRAEVYTSVANSGGYEGQDWYYGWWTMFPAAGNTGWWATGGDFNVFTQFHGPGAAGAQEQFGVDDTSGTPRLYFEVDTRQNGGSDYQKWPLGSLQFEHWYHYVLHVKWSTSSSGYVQLWQDGTEVVPLTYHQTLYPISGASAYWKQGFYRATVNATNTVYQDGAVRADSYTAAAQG